MIDKEQLLYDIYEKPDSERTILSAPQRATEVAQKKGIVINTKEILGKIARDKKDAKVQNTDEIINDESADSANSDSSDTSTANNVATIVNEEKKSPASTLIVETIKFNPENENNKNKNEESKDDESR